MKRLVAIACLAGCGTFEDPNVVIDLRVLAMTATPPEQVVDVAPGETQADLLAQLVPAKVCALVADGNFDRRLRYQLTLCNLDGSRCDLASAHLVIGEGLLDDPDLTVPEPQMCGTIPTDANLANVVLAALMADSLHGLGGIYYGVALRVGGEDADPNLDQYAFKSLRVMPRIPADITANTNPTLTGIHATVDGGLDTALELARCVDATTPLVLSPGQKVRLTPVEPDGVRETYVVPTTDGGERTFTEALTYQWEVGAGSLSKGSTGGPHDAFGNAAPLFTDYTAPAAENLDGPTDVPMWVVQRDERLGAAWFETCLRVVP